LGITTIIAGFIAWMMIFKKHSNVVILATKQEKSKIALKIVKNIIKYLPKWMVPSMVKIDIDNRTGIELNNGSTLNAITTSYDAGVGEAVSFLFVDEAALIERFDELWTRIKPTLSTGGRMCLASTPNGVR